MGGGCLCAVVLHFPAGWGWGTPSRSSEHLHGHSNRSAGFIEVARGRLKVVSRAFWPILVEVDSAYFGVQV